MASISHDGAGRRRIQFMLDGKRRTIRLGKCSAKQSQMFRTHVEAIVSASITSSVPDDETSRWLAKLDDTMHARLASVGLVKARHGRDCPTVADFIDGYIAQRNDLKSTTVTVLQQSRIWLVRFMGEKVRLDKVTTADADAYRAHMVASKLAKATIAKRCRYARHFFAIARRRKLIEENPFEHIKGAVKGDPSRRVFIPAERIVKVLEEVTCPQWRLLIGLARWGGIRVPSEAAALTWGDVNFERRRFIIRATKTEHHEGEGVRVVPMFPELEPLFQAAFDAASEGETRVLPICGNGTLNLRTQFKRYIVRAGEKPWAKLWQNLRVSRATELADTVASHVCAAWLGHSEKIADAFYRQVTEEHYERATMKRKDKAVQNPAQYGAEAGRKGRKADHSEIQENPVFPVYSAPCDTVQKHNMGDKGLEPLTFRV